MVHMLEPAKRPDFFYKYRSLQRLCERRRALRIIKTSNIYYATPASFNNPFDCKVPPVASFDPCFVRYLIAAQKAKTDDSHAEVYDKFIAARMRTQAELDELNAALSPAEQSEFNALVESIQRKANETGVLSFSAICNSTLMWSHYADNHRGICLKFSLEKWRDMSMALYPVAYPIKRLSLQLDAQSFGQGQLVQAVVLTKDQGWQYEQEWRVLGKAPGEFPFPADALVGIIFGCMTPDADKARVRRAIAGRTHVAFYQAKMKEAEFGLDVVPC